jgi:hypothetical protein
MRAAYKRALESAKFIRSLNCRTLKVCTELDSKYGYWEEPNKNGQKSNRK